MKYEKSCGAVIYTIDNGELKYLAIQSKKHQEWGLVKGHTEPGETEQETAIREVREETGLKIQIQDDFRTVISYQPAPNVHKDVVFFLAEVEAVPIQMQPEEVSDYRWGSYEEILDILPYETNKQVLQAAHHYLTEKMMESMEIGNP